MSRTIHVSMNEGEVVASCQSSKVGISAIESLPAGGVRLVCMSVDGAEKMRRKFKSKLIKTDIVRQAYRPSAPQW